MMDVLLEKGSLRIRSATPEDAGILSRWWNDGAVMAHAGYPNGLGISEHQVTELIQGDDDLDRRLMLEFDGLPIGEMNYRTPERGVAEIGIKICEANMQDRGYGTVFVKMLMGHLFESMGYEKIILDTNLKNRRAQAVYEKLGFRKTRTKRDAWRDQLGELQSSVEYEMTRAEFLDLQR